MISLNTSRENYLQMIVDRTPEDLAREHNETVDQFRYYHDNMETARELDRRQRMIREVFSFLYGPDLFQQLKFKVKNDDKTGAG